MRRPVRPSPARHRPRALARVRARDQPRLRGHQARLGAGQLQLLHLRRRRSDYVVDAVALVARDGWRLLPRLPLRPGDRAVAAPPRPGRTAAAAAPSVGYDADGAMRLPARSDAGPARTRSPATSPRRASVLAAASDPTAVPTRRTSTPTSTTCAGSTCPRSAAADVGVGSALSGPVPPSPPPGPWPGPTPACSRTLSAQPARAPGGPSAMSRNRGRSWATDSSSRQASDQG